MHAGDRTGITTFSELEKAMTSKLLAVFAALCLAAVGCRADVETTPGSTKVEIEGPRVTTGDRPVDLNPATDDDLDVDTPAPGDR
jgi:hypothetical protein